ncbi:MAG: glycosyltransferase family 4 protein [Bacteroidota bacterium]
MKVIFTFGGLAHYYNPILNRLNKINDIDLHVLIPATKSSSIGAGVFEKTDNVEFTLHRLEENKRFYGKNFFRGFIPFLEREKPDVVVTTWPYIFEFAFNPFLRDYFRRNKIKLIVKDIPFQLPRFNNIYKFYWNENLYSEEKGGLYKPTISGFFRFIIYTFIRKRVYTFADAHVDYLEEAKDILPSYGVDKNKIFIIYNSIDTNKYFEINKEVQLLPNILPENKFRIIHIGRLVNWKRVDLIIKAVSIIKNDLPEIELIVIGDGPQKDELVQLAKSLNVQNNINFIGGVYDPKTIGQYLKSSSIYVLAGMGGLSINEAMSFGKSIVCSVCDGTEKILVRDGFNGKYFKAEDEIDLAEKLNNLLSNNELIQEMGRNSLEIINNEINIDIVIKGYLEAFSFVTNKNYT